MLFRPTTVRDYRNSRLSNRIKNFEKYEFKDSANESLKRCSTIFNFSKSK